MSDSILSQSLKYCETQAFYIELLHELNELSMEMDCVNKPYKITACLESMKDMQKIIKKLEWEAYETEVA